MAVVKWKMAMIWNQTVNALIVGVKRGTVCQFTHRAVTLQ